MTINNENSFLDGAWDWAMFDGCFGETRIKPTDIDGFVERRGRFLVLETKGIGKPIPTGQMLTFEALASTGKFTIFVMWGDKNNPQKALLIGPKGRREYPQISREKCRRIVSEWFRRASN